MSSGEAKKTGWLPVAFKVGTMSVSMLMALCMAEVVVRVRNRPMQNYDIEMWRYARELKRPSADPRLGHEHVPGAQATLQNVFVRINGKQLRGDEVGPRQPDRRRILVLGSSITFGWGVAEEDTMVRRIESLFAAGGEKVEVLNAGIGNYNASRYIERFFAQMTDLEPTDIVLHAFVRDAEPIESGSGNILLRNSQLAATLWIAAGRMMQKKGEGSLADHYRALYRPEAAEFNRMKEAYGRLAAYARQKNIRVYMAMTPDIHNLADYPLGFVHDSMRQVAAEFGFAYVDLLPAFAGRTPQDIWAMAGDPHPNALGHKLMAERLFPEIKDPPHHAALVAEAPAAGRRSR